MPLLLAIAIATVATCATIGRAAYELLALIGQQNRILEQQRKSLAEYVEGGNADVAERLRAVEELADMLPAKWSELVSEAERIYGRARHISRRISKELEERNLDDDGATSLSHELQLVHGTGSGEEELPTVSEGMETFQPDASDSWRQRARESVRR